MQRSTYWRLGLAVVVVLWMATWAGLAMAQNDVDSGKNDAVASNDTGAAANPRQAVMEDVEVQGTYLRALISPGEGAPLDEMELVATGHDQAGAAGAILEGFGVGSFYVPNRRLNQKLEVDDKAGRPIVHYQYDCDGPNIAGLHVKRTMEAFPEEASVRVKWRVEHRGKAEQWVSPWVRSDVAPGGALDGKDAIDLPSVDGLEHATTPGYRPAARNWIAATDPVAKETIYAVFNAEELHSYAITRETGAGSRALAFQAAFLPRLMKPGDTWETTYRFNVVRGLDRVDFATDELAAELTYVQGELQLLIASAKKLPELVIQASVLAPNGQVWKLERKKFTATPDSLIRCRFAWNAPGDGAFEFLAQLLKDEKPFPLGADTASPHGGIDTQFVVGQPTDVTFEPWTDAPHALDRHARSVKRTMAAEGDVAVWFEDPLEKVFPDDIPVPTGTVNPEVKVGLARNEAESVQIVVRPPEDLALEQVNVVLHDLADEAGGATIPASCIEAARVAYCPVRVPSHFEGPTGEWPDPLPPLTPFSAPAGRCSPIWLTIHAPTGIPAGTYAGILELTAANRDAIELQIEATVYDFDLPARPALKTDFGFFPDEALESCRRFGYQGSQETLSAAYLENALAHRVTLREAAGFPPESADYGAALREYAKRLEGGLAARASTFCVPDSLLDVPEQLKQADAFVAEHKLNKRVFCHVADTPLRPAWPRLLERMQQWMTTVPNIPLMVTTLGLDPFFHDGAAIWAIHLPMFDTSNGRTILERIQGGGEVWCYVSHDPPRPYGNLFVDFAGIEHRILFWQTWALGMRGFHYSSINACPPDRDPWRGVVDVTPANGDGFLVYPSANGPVNSIRWEIIRDGIEDFDYLVLLQGAMRAASEKGGQDTALAKATEALNLKDLVPDLVSFPRDPKVLRARRDAIAKAIVGLAGGEG